MNLIASLLTLYWFAVLIRIILEWFPMPSDHPVGRLRRMLSTIVDPVLAPIRRVIPPIPIGMQRLDLSPIVLLIGIQILISIIT